MSLFQNLTNEGLEENQDRLGGFELLDSDIYVMTIKAAYAGKSKNGATFVSIIADANGQEYRETFYVTNREGNNYYLNDNKKKIPLPGFSTVDDLCLIASNKSLAEQNTEDKILNIYDPQEKKEVPKSVPVLTDLTNQKVALAILKQLENKSVLQNGEYTPIQETRKLNVVDKVFHPEARLTVFEARNGQEEAKFWDKWLERNKGTVKDKRTVKDGQKNSTSGPPTSSNQPATRKSLFGNK